MSELYCGAKPKQVVAIRYVRHRLFIAADNYLDYQMNY